MLKIHLFFHFFSRFGMSITSAISGYKPPPGMFPRFMVQFPDGYSQLISSSAWSAHAFTQAGSLPFDMRALQPSHFRTFP